MFALDFFLSMESDVTPTVNVPSAHKLRLPTKREVRGGGEGWSVCGGAAEHDSGRFNPMRLLRGGRG